MLISSAKLALGPMSSEVIEAAFMFSQERAVQLMLIASKSQIDHCGGYVNNWNTYQYASYITEMREKYPWSNILVCRDHCGPGFSGSRRQGGADLLDSYQTIDTDLACGFDFIHVDLCFLREKHKTKLQWSHDVIKYILKQSPTTMIEVGTDENTGDAILDINRLTSDVDFFLGFCKPEFYVAQTGSLVKEISHTGTFNRDVVSEISKLLHSKGVKLKEHNADYLPKDQIELRHDVVDAMNIAPMLGTLQTQFVLFECMKRGIDTTAFLEKSYNSCKWKKWLCKNTKDNKYLCALVAGHYNFTSKEYQQLMDKLAHSWIGVHEAIIKMFVGVIDRYLIGIEGFKRENKLYV